MLKRLLISFLILCSVSGLSFIAMKLMNYPNIHIDGTPVGDIELICLSIGIALMPTIFAQIFFIKGDNNGSDENYFDCTGGAGGIM